ncbi:DUF1643 domain-containing protein [Mycolicibacterium boenickei]|nr:DUF1643 domain-containing protein [Mycolicibacterium boenickei]
MPDQLGLFTDAVASSAVISGCGRYRYELIRRWDDGPLLEFVMLNPSTADASLDDPTIRRCIAFAKAWGYCGIVVRNLYALRATNPQVLLNYSGDAYGPRNDEFIVSNVADCTIAAWGSHAATLWPETLDTIKILDACRPQLFCLGVNANGSPKHPLYVPSSRTPVRWENLNA